MGPSIPALDAWIEKWKSRTRQFVLRLRGRVGVNKKETKRERETLQATQPTRKHDLFPHGNLDFTPSSSLPHSMPYNKNPSALATLKECQEWL